MSRELLQQALTALNTCDWDYDSEEEPYKTFDEDLVNAAAAALKAELAELEDAEIGRRYTEALAQGWKECFDRAAAVTLQAAFEKQAKEKNT
jgi:hypothetical protein